MTIEENQRCAINYLIELKKSTKGYGVNWLDLAIKALEQRWIPVSEGLPKLDEEACSDNVLVSLRETTWDIFKCRMVHITKIAYYNKYAISSDGRYMDTEGWVLADRNTLSMDEVIAWMPLPQPYKAESEEI